MVTPQLPPAQEKGIDWIVEEMRPMDAEALHRLRHDAAEHTAFSFHKVLFFVYECCVVA